MCIKSKIINLKTIIALSLLPLTAANAREAKSVNDNFRDINLQCNGNYKKNYILNGSRSTNDISHRVNLYLNINFSNKGSIYFIDIKSEDVDWSVSNYQPHADRVASDLSDDNLFKIRTNMKLDISNDTPNGGNLITEIELSRVTGMLNASRYLILDTGTLVEKIYANCSKISGNSNKF